MSIVAICEPVKVGTSRKLDHLLSNRFHLHTVKDWQSHIYHLTGCTQGAGGLSESQQGLT